MELEEDLGYLANLPPELKYQALERLDVKSLLNACTAGKTLRFICEDDVFWRKKTMKDFFLNEEIIKHMPDNISWFKIYEYLFTGKTIKTTLKTLSYAMSDLRLSIIFDNLRHDHIYVIPLQLQALDEMNEELRISILEAMVDYAISNSLLGLITWTNIIDYITKKLRHSDNPAFEDLLMKIFRVILTRYKLSYTIKPINSILIYLPPCEFKKVFGVYWKLVKEIKEPESWEEILSTVLCGILEIREGDTDAMSISKLDYAMSITGDLIVDVLGCPRVPQVFDDFYNKYVDRIRVTNTA